MRAALAVWLLAMGVACGPGGRSHNPNACTEGEMQCDGQTLSSCVGGKFVAQEVCPEACTAQFGCSQCAPGTGTCSGNLSHACNDDGTGYLDTMCNPVQGETCDSNTGQCTGSCAPKALGTSYIGCEYYPTVIGNMVSDQYHFAVAVANTTNEPAMVTIEEGALATPQMFTVAPQSVNVHLLPWQPTLKLCVGMSWSNCSGTQVNGAFATHGAYHLRSTAPVTVYQFNPLEYTLAGATEDSFTVDASLLLPTNTWRNKYFVAAWQNTSSSPSELAVTGMEDNTKVTITTRAPTTAAGGAPAFTPNVPQMVTLNRGDVIELASIMGDLTGSVVESDKPVAVIGGHYCADVPDLTGACDHLEESMFAVDTLGTHYIVNAPAVTTIPNGKVEVVRIIATSANTTLTYDPPQPGAPTTIAHPGDFVEISGNASSFSIMADQKIMVAQYMEGQDAGGNTGDPSLALAVPVEQFRSSYMFHAPINYDSNYVDVTATVGTTVTLDGVPIAFVPIGATGYALGRVYPLNNGPANDGNHTIAGNQPFGITVYGYGQYTSYWYPGGLDLNTIIN